MADCSARSEATNVHLRLLTRSSYGLSPESLMAMAQLTRGGLCPPLPGREIARSPPADTSGEPSSS